VEQNIEKDWSLEYDPFITGGRDWDGEEIGWWENENW
jgi:hypothetical protein